MRTRRARRQLLVAGFALQSLTGALTGLGRGSSVPLAAAALLASHLRTEEAT